MSPFPSHKHLFSWAGISPGNHESGGKRKPAQTKKGNQWLRAILVERGHAAGRSQGTYLGAQYRRLAARKGKKRAAVAVGHSILEAIYFIIRDDVPYQELGPRYLDELNKAQIIRHHVRRLESFGLKVEIQQLSSAA